MKKQFVWFGLLIFLLILALGITFVVFKHRQTLTKVTVSCSAYTLDQCPTPSCVVCPPCPECSSLSCQAAAKCKSIGIDERWYNAIKNQRLN